MRVHPHRTSFSVATINDDFNTPKSNLPHVKADVLLGQEEKFEHVRKLLGKKWGVHQAVRREDQQGTAVAWNRDVFQHRPKDAAGYAMGVRPHGHALLTRWINYTDLSIDGKQVRMASVHRPPKRDSALWPEFDRNLKAFVAKHDGPIIIGMDANQENPQRMAKEVGLRWVAPGPGSIDGFLVSKGVHVEHPAHRLKKGSSDHAPVKARFSIRTPSKDVR